MSLGPVEAASPGTRIGPVAIGACLGRWGDVLIYEAEQPGVGPVWLHEYVPVQIAARQGGAVRSRTGGWRGLLASGAQAFVERGERLTRWKGRNALPVLSVGSSDDGAWWITPSLTGARLSDLLPRTGTLPRTTARQLAREIAASVAGLHKIGLAHGAVSPRAVFVTDEPKWRAVLIPTPPEGDLARALPTAGLPDRTDPFPAFERHVRGAPPADVPGDIHALAATLTQILTGSPPAPAPARFRQAMRPHPTGELDDTRLLLAAGLAIDPAERPSNVADLIAPLALPARATTVSPAAAPALNAIAEPKITLEPESEIETAPDLQSPADEAERQEVSDLIAVTGEVDPAAVEEPTEPVETAAPVAGPIIEEPQQSSIEAISQAAEPEAPKSIWADPDITSPYRDISPPIDEEGEAPQTVAVPPVAADEPVARLTPVGPAVVIPVFPTTPSPGQADIPPLEIEPRRRRSRSGVLLAGGAAAVVAVAAALVVFGMAQPFSPDEEGGEAAEPSPPREGTATVAGPEPIAPAETPSGETLLGVDGSPLATDPSDDPLSSEPSDDASAATQATLPQISSAPVIPQAAMPPPARRPSTTTTLNRSDTGSYLGDGVTPRPSQPRPAPSPVAPTTSQLTRPARTALPLGSSAVIAAPSAQQRINALSPAAAARIMRGDRGMVQLSCIVQQGGSLADCSIQQETPPGLGLSSSALALAPVYRVSNNDTDGLATVGRRITFWLIFAAPTR